MSDAEFERQETPRGDGPDRGGRVRASRGASRLEPRSKGNARASGDGKGGSIDAAKPGRRGRGSSAGEGGDSRAASNQQLRLEDGELSQEAMQEALAGVSPGSTESAFDEAVRVMRAEARGDEREGKKKKKKAKKAKRRRREAAALANTRPLERELDASRVGLEAQIRFRLTSVLRLSDALIRKVVGAYDRLFELETEEQARIYLRMGREFREEGKADEALEALRSAAKICPEDSRPWLEIGLIYLEREATAAAISALRKGLELGAPSVELYWSLGDALIQEERYEEAVVELERAVELNPQIADSFFRLGTCLDQLGRYQEAADNFACAVELDAEEVPYHQSLGFALESAGRRHEAIRCFKRALQIERQRWATE
ncbi:MAG: tetratricopeptide repeat protein [Myxococcales bacterium]|nr:tetratricopeptide repeat protein [Myxococcales bacterium]